MPQPSVDDELKRSRLITLVDQLKIHYKMERVRVSKTTQEMIQYCGNNLNNDPLVFPVKDNPFKEKKSCAIL